MDEQHWVIDTCVIAESNVAQAPHYMEAIGLLMSIMEKHKIAVDNEDAISTEYDRHMPFGSFARQWWITINSTTKVTYLSSHVPNRTRIRLIDDLKFDLDDLKFVGVASRTSSKFLVSRDSDYNTPVVECLANELGIQFFDIPSARVKRQLLLPVDDN